VTAIAESEDPDAAWAAVQERELETVPLIPTVRAPYVEGYSSRLQGHTPSSLFSLRDLDQAWLSVLSGLDFEKAGYKNLAAWWKRINEIPEVAKLHVKDAHTAITKQSWPEGFPDLYSKLYK